MTQLASFSRIVLGAALGLLLVSACGGQSFGTGDGEAGSGGSSAGTSSGKGGSASQGGSTSGGGKTASGGKGGSAPTAGTTGVGGAPSSAACTAPAVTGNCEAAFPRWFHDATTGVCRPFTYGGCGGNANNYESLAACQAACHGGSPNYDACQAPSDCVVAGGGCCGLCPSPNITAHDLTAYNRAYAAEISQCGTADIACAACAPVAGNTLPYFVPNCVRGECIVEDLRTSSVTACKDASECRLRHGSHCCEGCGGQDNLIAVRSDGSFEELVCGDEPVACPACLPQPVPGAQATCASGHCEVVYLLNAGG